MAKNRFKILIVEDDANIRTFVRTMLEAEDYQVLCAADCASGLSMFSSHCPDLVILDLGLPDMDGTEFIRHARKTSTIPVIMLTAKDETFDKVLGLELGADDYITKPFDTKELVARVKSQIRRYTQLGNMGQQNSSQVYKCGGLMINDETKEVTVDGDPIRLTPIEYNILLLLVKNAGKVFSIDQIYEKIWNEDAIGADNTVAVHIRHIREKIEINPKEPRYLKVVWGVGYKIEKQ